MEKISWTDCVRNKELLPTVKEDRNTLHTIKTGKVNWIGHIFCRNYILKHATEGKMEKRIELMGRYEEEDVSSF
jgi:hypothetical protein